MSSNFHTHTPTLYILCEGMSDIDIDGIVAPSGVENLNIVHIKTECFISMHICVLYTCIL